MVLPKVRDLSTGLHSRIWTLANSGQHGDVHIERIISLTGTVHQWLFTTVHILGADLL